MREAWCFSRKWFLRVCWQLCVWVNILGFCCVCRLFLAYLKHVSYVGLNIVFRFPKSPIPFTPLYLCICNSFSESNSRRAMFIHTVEKHMDPPHTAIQAWVESKVSTIITHSVRRVTRIDVRFSFHSMSCVRRMKTSSVSMWTAECEGRRNYGKISRLCFSICRIIHWPFLPIFVFFWNAI